LATYTEGGRIQIWDLRTWELRHTIAVPYPVGALAVTAENEIVVGTGQEIVIFNYQG
jgi:hypothetical protein